MSTLKQKKKVYSKPIVTKILLAGAVGGILAMCNALGANADCPGCGGGCNCQQTVPNLGW